MAMQGIAIALDCAHGCSLDHSNAASAKPRPLRVGEVEGRRAYAYLAQAASRRWQYQCQSRIVAFRRNPEINVSVKKMFLVENVILYLLDIGRLDPRIAGNCFNVCC